MKQLAVLIAGIVLVGCSSTTNSESVTKSSESVTVFKDAMKKQCFADGISLDTMKSTLTISGVTVFCAERHNDGLVYAQVCGNDEGTINVFSISKSDLDTAKTLGFKEITELKSARIKTSCGKTEK